MDDEPTFEPAALAPLVINDPVITALIARRIAAKGADDEGQRRSSVP